MFPLRDCAFWVPLKKSFIALKVKKDIFFLYILLKFFKLLLFEIRALTHAECIYVNNGREQPHFVFLFFLCGYLIVSVQFVEVLPSPLIYNAPLHIPIFTN